MFLFNLIIYKSFINKYNIYYKKIMYSMIKKIFLITILISIANAVLDFQKNKMRSRSVMVLFFNISRIITGQTAYQIITNSNYQTQISS